MKGGKTIWRDLQTLANQDSHGQWVLSLEERKSVVTSAIDQLPDPSRMLLALRYYEGLGIHELSEALGTAPEEVKQTIASAMNQVYTALVNAEQRELKGASE